MSEHKVTVKWERSSEDFSVKGYNRHHHWEISGQSVPASAAPGYGGDDEHVDPEQAFTAALSSCHMLTFLFLAAKQGLTVDRYTDAAVGEAGKNEDGRYAVTRVTLRPKIEFGGEEPDRDTLEKLHEQAHKGCFIANSVKSKVDVEF